MFFFLGDFSETYKTHEFYFSIRIQLLALLWMIKDILGFEKLPNKKNINSYDIYSQNENNNYPRIFTKIENLKLQNQ